MWNVEDRYGPVIEMYEVEGTSEKRVVIGYKMGGTQHFFRLAPASIATHLPFLIDLVLFSALSELYHFYGLYSARKYVGKLIPYTFRTHFVLYPLSPI